MNYCPTASAVVLFKHGVRVHFWLGLTSFVLSAVKRSFSYDCDRIALVGSKAMKSTSSDASWLEYF